MDDSPGVAPNGSDNPLLALCGDSPGLRFSGVVVAIGEIVEGISKKTDKPYCLRTSEASDGIQSFKIIQRAENGNRSGLPGVLTMFQAVNLRVESVAQENYGQIELQGSVIEGK